MEKRNKSFEKRAKTNFNTKIDERRNEEAEKSGDRALKNRQRIRIINLTTIKKLHNKVNLFVDFLEQGPCCCQISVFEIS